MKTKKLLALLLAGVMLFCFASCSGSAKVSAELNDIYEDIELRNYFANNPETFIKIAQQHIGMTEEAAQSFLANPDDWQVYSLVIDVENSGKEAFTFAGFNPVPSPDEGFYFSNFTLSGELSIPGGLTGEAFPAAVLVNSEEIDTAGLYTLVSALEITIYGYPTSADENDEVSEEDYEYISVKNNITAPEVQEPEKNTELTAKHSTIEDGSDYLTIYRNNKNLFPAEAALYGMDDETAAQVMDENGGWECYTLYITVENKTDGDLTIYSILPENNGANGVWVNGISQYGEFSMPGNTSDEMPVSVMVNPAQMNGQSLNDILSAMNILIEYSESTVIDAAGNESIEIKKTVAIS